MIDKEGGVSKQELRDIPSKLFRKILNVLNINNDKWVSYLNEHIKWEVPEDPKGFKVTKEKRSTAASNYISTFFKKKTLTFNKLLTGLSILKIRKIKVTIEIEDRDGKHHSVSEEYIVKSSKDYTVEEEDK